MTFASDVAICVVRFCETIACGWRVRLRIRRGPGSPTRSRQSFDCRPLRKCRCRTLLKQANLLLNRSGTQIVLRLCDGRRTSLVTVRQCRRAPDFAHQPGRVQWERCVTRSTEVPQFKGVPGFHCQVLNFLVRPPPRTLRVQSRLSTSGILAPEFRSKRCTEPGATRSAI